jgi:hypothetical protein
MPITIQQPAPFRMRNPARLKSRSQRPRGLRRGPAATRLLVLWVRIRPGARMSVSCECCVLSRTGLCIELITRPEESYRLWCVSECDREASIMRRPWPTGGCQPWKRNVFARSWRKCERASSARRPNGIAQYSDTLKCSWRYNG